jgi:hypothetical protein
VLAILGEKHPAGAVLLTDGYAPYASYAEKFGLIHAQCWAHARREVFEAEGSDPDGARGVLQRIGALFDIEADVENRGLTGGAKQQHRQTHSKPLADALFAWVATRLQEYGLRPGTPFTRAIGYAHVRREGLEVFLGDPRHPDEHEPSGARAPADPKGALIVHLIFKCLKTLKFESLELTDAAVLFVRARW